MVYFGLSEDWDIVKCLHETNCNRVKSVKVQLIKKNNCACCSKTRKMMVPATIKDVMIRAAMPKLYVKTVLISCEGGRKLISDRWYIKIPLTSTRKVTKLLVESDPYWTLMYDTVGNLPWCLVV